MRAIPTKSSSQDLEYDFEYSPAWRFVGKHMRWTSQMETLAKQYVNRALGLPVNQSTPQVRDTLNVWICGQTLIGHCSTSPFMSDTATSQGGVGMRRT